jgi:hypothetical protein
MSNRQHWLTLIIWIVFLLRVDAQDTSTPALPRDSTLTFADSLNIFRLIDSLLSLDSGPHSQLATRLAYNNNVLWTGRTLGIDQFGLSPGVSYYHKSGLFADVSAFWSKDFEPNYYLTILSGGYMHTFSKKFYAIASYDRYFYSLDDAYIPYNNALTLTPFFELKPVVFRMDYSFFFGEMTAHRLMPSLGVNIQKKNLFKLDRISTMPTAYVLAGDQTITELIFPTTRQEWIAAYLRFRQGLPWYTVQTKRVYGIMNYAFMLPVSIRHRKWSFSLSYTYNIPKALPGETLTLEESSFISSAFTYFFDLGRRKSPL